MCGIAGIFAYHGTAPPVDREELLRIREAMLTRGPDGAGLWISADQRTGLAHRRLTIIDLTDAGAQPMATADGRFRITFNGEIYNYRELKRDLEARGYRFASNSDTEVLLHLYTDRGAEMVHALRGMYAFGIWDEREKELFLARDPFGIKPLYYADDGRSLRFASQVKALLKGGAIEKAPEPAGSVGFLIWGCVPEPYTLYRDIRSVEAGTHVRVSRAGIVTTRFFDIGDEFRHAEDARPAPAESAREILRRALADSVKHHLVSDVPVGLFLSAGLDSSVLAALATEQQADGLTAVTLGFPEFRGTDHDEVPMAARVARDLGIRHEAHWIQKPDFDSELDRILEAMDQPSTDGVNTYFVSQAAARAGMKVAFSGLGGDELFGGYPSYAQVPRAASRLGFVRGAPIAGRFARRVLAPLVSAVTSPKYASLLEYGGSYGGAYLLRRALFMPWEAVSILDPTTVAVGLDKLRILERLEATAGRLRQPRSRIAALEISWYLRNQLLRDADWAGMAHSVEIRVPLLDVELLRALAPLMVSDRYPTKLDVAAVLRTPLPDQVLSRAKTGFTTPVRDWISTPAGSSPTTRGLRGWAQRVLPPQPRMFRALVLVTDAFGGAGGIAKFNRDLVTALASMPECAEVVVTPRLVGSSVERIPPHVTFRADAAGSKLRFVRSAFTEAFRGNVDLLVSGHINLAPLSALLAFLKGSRSLLVVHGIDAWTRRIGFLASRSLSRFDVIAGVSELTLARFASWAHVDSSRFRLLPNCVDARQYGPGPKPAQLADRLGLKDRTVIMTLGRLATEERYKGFDEILEVLPALARQIPDISYLICGDGADRGRLEAKAQALAVRDRVVFTGFVPEEQKADHYRLADAYVMPSRGEGFGIVLLEALACGIPALGSQLDGSREALMGGALGCLADPSKSSDVEAGVLATLKRGTGHVPADLSHYSLEAFGRRTELIVREALQTSLRN
jgi:asparagine synthase (glutamine-hydrolysing)